MAKRIVVRRWDEKQPDMDLTKNNSFTHAEPSVEVLYKEIVILIGDTHASLLYNERLHGVSPKGKHWFRFNTPRKIIYTIKKNSYGEPVGRMFYKEGKFFHNIAQDFEHYARKLEGADNHTIKSFVGLDVFSMAIRDVASRNGVEIPLEASIFSRTFLYPVLTPLDSTRREKIPSKITRYASTNDLSVFVKRAFGKSRYRKDLVKSVADLRSMTIFMLGYSFRGLVPIDWIIDFYRKNAFKNPQLFSGSTFLDDLYTLLKILPQKQVHKLFHLLRDQVSVGRMSNMIADDIFRSLQTIKDSGHFEGLEDIKFTSLKEAHDKLAVFARVAQAMKENKELEKPLPVTKLSSMFLGPSAPTINGISLVPAKTAKDLVMWGAQMGHCIGSYTRQAMSGKSTFMAVHKDGKMIGNLEYEHTNSRLVQLFGQYNKKLDADIVSSVFWILLQRHGICYENLSGCWGIGFDVQSDPKMLELRKMYSRTAKMTASTTSLKHYFVAIGNVMNQAGQQLAQLDWEPLGRVYAEADANFVAQNPWRLDN